MRILIVSATYIALYEMTETCIVKGILPVCKITKSIPSKKIIWMRNIIALLA